MQSQYLEYEVWGKNYSVLDDTSPGCLDRCFGRFSISDPFRLFVTKDSPLDRWWPLEGVGHFPVQCPV